MIEVIVTNLFHTFHIPVMGIGFTIDTPVKVAHYGISSVISLVDDGLIEKMREMLCKKHSFAFEPIPMSDVDYRAKRITLYLNCIHSIVEKNCQRVLDSILGDGKEIRRYFSMLPDSSPIKKEFFEKIKTTIDIQTLHTWIKNTIRFGSIDVNIMTKLDRTHYHDGQPRAVEFNDAHSALRGFVLSTLNSSIVFSAGLNPRLFTYAEEFNDFYPQPDNTLKKKIILKVSDYRSAMIQGKMFARKGLWVSEYRIESGVNCGGHAFTSDGHLMGPICDEFKNNRQTLIESTHDVFTNALRTKGKYIPQEMLPLTISAQGGVGTAEEHNFLMERYTVDSVGWGSPFLLVPDVVNIDDKTLDLLIHAQEDDLFMSKTSPLGIPFNIVKNTSKDIEKASFIKDGTPGSICTKQCGALNTEFSEIPLCTASRLYQKNKIAELDSSGLINDEYDTAYNAIVDKTCICVGLGTSALLVNDLDTTAEGTGVSVCPGPNIAYFSQKVSLDTMVDHIYGRTSLVTSQERPFFLMKELSMYSEILKNNVSDAGNDTTSKTWDALCAFRNNILSGITYYESLLPTLTLSSESLRNSISETIEHIKHDIMQLQLCLTP